MNITNLVGISYYTHPKPYKRKVEPVHKSSTKDQNKIITKDKEEQDSEPTKVCIYA